MKCPNCNRDLRETLTRQGVEVDYCESCCGVWLDRGEIYMFASQPEEIARNLEHEIKKAQPMGKASPKNGQAMTMINYPGGARLQLCESGGIWLDAADLDKLKRNDKNIELDLDIAGMTSSISSTGRSMGKPILFKLPNLFLRSAGALLGLYLLLGLVLIAAVEFGGLGVETAVGIGIAIVVFQFLFGPWLMDLSLRWMYDIRWLSPEQLPAHLRQFAEQVCTEQGVKFPRFGVLNDGAPQAFTYGHTPNNARIVISKGIMDLLEPDEVEAVVAHEIGHAVHWDMLLMTLVQLVPLIMYYLYRTFSRFKSGNDDKGKAAAAIALVSYILYVFCEYVVLAFSRIREYHADRFSGEVTGNPSLLASALVKIAYGLAGHENEEKEKQNRNPRLSAVATMGIFDGTAAQALAISSYAPGGSRRNVKAAMCWDLWNPWARWYELNSTHPLVAKRLNYLGNQSLFMGREPYIQFDLKKPESYWDEFLVDLLVYLSPLLLPLVILLLHLVSGTLTSSLGESLLGPALLIGLGFGLLLRYGFSYRAASFPEMSVAALLRHVKVSDIRPVPCTLRGTVIGKGVPGYIFSEDFVLQDESGIIFLDMRQPLRIWEAMFGLMLAGEYQGKEVVARGWYRRSPVPYVELQSISISGKERKSWVPALKKASAILLMAAGMIWAVMGLI